MILLGGEGEPVLRSSELSGPVAWRVVAHVPEFEGEESMEDGLVAEVPSVRVLVPEPLVEVEAHLKGEEDVELAVHSTASWVEQHPV